MALKTFAVFSRDPAPTERLIAVLDAIRTAPVQGEMAGLASLRSEYEATCCAFEIISRPPGLAMWQQAGFSVRSWDQCDDSAATDLLVTIRASIVMTGTSDVDEPADRALWRAARAAGVASHAVLDQRINLGQRFTDADGAITYPDWIYVSDDEFGTMIAKIGVPANRIRVIGDLHLENLKRRMAGMSEERLSQIRTQWGVPSGRRIVLFASETMREKAVAGYPVPYEEMAELERLLAALDAGGHPAAQGSAPSEICVVVRPHPRDTAGKYDGYAGVSASGLKVVVSSAGGLESIKAADIIVGMNSSLLHAAVVSGLAVLSLTGHPLGIEPGATR